MVESGEPDTPVTPDTPLTPERARTGEHPSRHDSKAVLGLNRSVHWLADYVYGTISTLVALAGLTFETHPEALTTAGVVVVGAVAIWLAHTLSRLITTRSWHHMTLKRSDIREELLSSWPILAAAIPATIVFTLSGLHLWKVWTAFVIADVIGVLALAVVGTAGGGERPLGRRILYVGALVSVGVAIVLLESVVHLL
jgi:hypothetical protein